MASASGQPIPDYPIVQNPGMPMPGPGGVTGVANIDYVPGYGPNQPGGGAPPGFSHGGGPSSMAMVDYFNPTTRQTWTANSGGWNPGEGWRQGTRSGAGWNPWEGGGGGMLNPPVQNPGMPMPGGPGTPIDGAVTVIGGGGGGLRPAPPVQNPGMPIDNGPVMKPVPGGRLTDGLQKGTLGGVRDFIQAGKMGRAKQAFEAGGGTWSSDVSRRLRNKYG